MKIYWLIITFTLLASCRQPSAKQPSKPTGTSNPNATVIVYKDYSLCKTSILSLKKRSKANWGKLSLLNKEKVFAAAVTDSIVPQWIGTDWGFYGTTQVPREGQIACGYFVTTVLQDAGLPIARTKLAQCASEQMIRTLVQPSLVQRFSNVSLQDFVSNIKQQGFGLYIVGLDCHTGFIYNDGKEVYFIHANYSGERKVIKEPALASWVLGKSKYRITGKISGDERVLQRWISG